MSKKFYLEKAKNYLSPASSLYRKEDGEYAPSYDYDATIELVANLIEIAKLLSDNSCNYEE
jgi:hypothetical protein